MDLEARLTRGQTLWITSFTFDVVACTAELSCTTTPETGKPDRSVLFKGVGRVSVDRFDDPDDSCVGNLIGLEVRPTGTRVSYLVNTGSSEILFEADAGPEVQFDGVV